MGILLFDAIKEKTYVTILSAIGIFFLVPVIQSISTRLAFDIWFLDLYQKPLSSIPYFAFSILFGMFIGLYLFSKNKCIDCKPNVKTGIGGTTLGFMIGVCPACFSFIGFLLPLSGSLFLSNYSPLFLLVSIGIILYSMHRLGGFKNSTILNFKTEKKID